MTVPNRSNAVLNRSNVSASDFLQLDANTAPSRGLTDWLVAALRRALTEGRLSPGSTLPPSRILAAELSVSRGVVTEAYRRLADDGLVTARSRTGTVVIAAPAAANGSRSTGTVEGPTLTELYALPVDAELLHIARKIAARFDLSPGLPDLGAFPRADWLRAERAVFAGMTRADLGYGDPRGAPALRAALARRLARLRGISIDPANVLVIAGVAQAFGLIAPTLRAAGIEAIAVEDPGPLGARNHLQHWGLRTPPVPVDDLGLDVAALRAAGHRAVLVTPAHQFPTGVQLSAVRRHELQLWAAGGGLIVEDDYDAEHRYERSPTPALHAAMPDSVCYLGSVSKLLAPALRLGWMVVPGHLLPTVVDAKRFDDLGNPTLPQLTLAQLIESGDLERHLRMLRRRHGRRRDAMLAALRTHLPQADVQGAAAGLHLTVTFDTDVSDLDLAAAAARHDVKVHPLAWYAQRPAPPGFVLGYAANPPHEIAAAIEVLGAAYRSVVGTGRPDRRYSRPAPTGAGERVCGHCGHALAGEALGERTQATPPVAQAGPRRPGTAGLVGRDYEFAVLGAALAEAKDGHAQVVNVLGEAGAGKTRLCDELARAAEASGVTVRRTAGRSHALSVPMLAILDLVRSFYDVVDADSPSQVRAKVAERLLGLDRGFAADLPLMYDFLEVPDPDEPAPPRSPAARRRAVTDVFRRSAALRSQHETRLMILEDLHWFDPHSVEFLTGWLPSFAGTRTLVVTNFRPEFTPPWAQWPYSHGLTLAPLDPDAVRRLIDELLGPRARELGAEVLHRAAGNPLFVEEIVRALIEDGTLGGAPGDYRLTRPVVAVRVPANLQAILGQRIDRLPAREKAALQTAAVIGTSFGGAVLAAAASLASEELDAALRTLCESALLREADGRAEYRFWHPLTQEVAYASLPAASRRRVHGCVAGALLTVGPDRHEELAALVATHFEAAADHLEAARWKLRAGAWTSRAGFGAAARLLHSALDHLDSAPDTADALAIGVRARTLLLRFGARAGTDLGEAEHMFEEAWAAAARLQDSLLLAGVSTAVGTARLWGGDVAGALEAWRELSRQAEATGDRELRAFALTLLAAAYAYTGPLAEGVQAADTALALCGSDELTGLQHAGYSSHDAAVMARAQLQILTGPLDAAAALTERTLRLYEQRPVSDFHAWALTQVVAIADLIGDPDLIAGAEAAASQAIRLAGDSVGVGAKAVQAAGLAALLDGRSTEAAATFGEALARARGHRAGLMEEGSLLASLARAEFAGGNIAAARAAADEAVAVADRQGARVVECLAQLVRAHVWRAGAESDADLEVARAAAAAGSALAGRLGARTYGAFLAEELAWLDDDPEAMRRAVAGYHAIGAGGQARRLAGELAAR